MQSGRNASRSRATVELLEGNLLDTRGTTVFREISMRMR
jgi:hypothetical protein